jgi:hypothetical protein
MQISTINQKTQIIGIYTVTHWIYLQSPTQACPNKYSVNDTVVEKTLSLQGRTYRNLGAPGLVWSQWVRKIPFSWPEFEFWSFGSWS